MGGVSDEGHRRLRRLQPRRRRHVRGAGARQRRARGRAHVGRAGAARGHRPTACRWYGSPARRASCSARRRRAGGADVRAGGDRPCGGPRGRARLGVAGRRPRGRAARGLARRARRRAGRRRRARGRRSAGHAAGPVPGRAARRRHGAETRVATDVCFCCKTAVAAGADGSVYVAWRHIYPPNVRDIAVARSTDGGRTFGAPVRVSEDGWAIDGCPDDGPSIAVDARGRLHVAWPTLVAGAPARASSTPPPWTAAHVCAPSARRRGAGGAAHPQLAVAGDRVAVAWDQSGGSGPRRGTSARSRATQGRRRAAALGAASALGESGRGDLSRRRRPRRTRPRGLDGGAAGRLGDPRPAPWLDTPALAGQRVLASFRCSERRCMPSSARRLGDVAAAVGQDAVDVLPLDAREARGLRRPGRREGRGCTPRANAARISSASAGLVR